MSQIGYERQLHKERLARQRRAQERETAMFATPSAPSGGIKWESIKGALLIIEPTSFEEGIVTAFGVADAVKANVDVIDGPGAGDTYSEALVFPKILASQLKNSLGSKVLGRLAQGTAKPGQSAPWLLEAATAEDTAKAEAHIAKAAKPAVTSAAPPF